MKLQKALELRKAKYVKRWRGEDGKWHYSYSLTEAKKIREKKEKEAIERKDIKSKLSEGEISFFKRMKIELRRNKFGVSLRKIGIEPKDIKKKLPYVYKYLHLDHLKNTGVGILNEEGKKVFRKFIYAR